MKKDLFKIGEILLVVKNIPNEEISVKGNYLSMGTKLRVVNVFHELMLDTDRYHVVDITNKKAGVFGIIDEDIESGSVVSLSQMREDKLNSLL